MNMYKKNSGFKWWAAEHNSDPKILSLSIGAELLYRRLIDLIWQSPGGRFPNDKIKAFYAAGRGFNFDEFNLAWAELVYPDFEALSATNDGKWIYSQRLKSQRAIIDKKAASGRLGGLKKRGGAMPRKTDPGQGTRRQRERRPKVGSRNDFFDAIRKMNED